MLKGLNAPFGAQCFPTGEMKGPVTMEFSLNAPFGAQCFPTLRLTRLRSPSSRSQCTFWCSVLSD